MESCLWISTPCSHTGCDKRHGPACRHVMAGTTGMSRPRSNTTHRSVIFNPPIVLTQSYLHCMRNKWNWGQTIGIMSKLHFFSLDISKLGMGFWNGYNVHRRDLAGLSHVQTTHNSDYMEPHWHLQSGESLRPATSNQYGCLATTDSEGFVSLNKRISERQACGNHCQDLNVMMGTVLGGCTGIRLQCPQLNRHFFQVITHLYDLNGKHAMCLII